ncbi:MAG TPA: SMP-30/gluconolactonase/LRE family protein [Cellvibrio sp.]|nr:SMP-30/gluconolactonase/LRE family protein [Cellvibrio sp.]
MSRSPVFSLLLAFIGLQACQARPPVPTEEKQVTLVQCSGAAPAGDLLAVRIPGANATHGEPGLYEGPVWINGALYFSDFTFGQGFPSRIQRLDGEGVMTTAIENSGSNGLAVDAQGNIVAGTHSFKSVSRFNLATGERSPLAETYDGNVFNSPNDVAVAGDGTLYFTDPAFQRSAAPGGQRKTSVYRLATDGSVTVVDSSIDNPNGIALSRADNVLYVNGGGEQGVLRAYPIINGIPQKGSDLVSDLSIPDGMTVDCHGNIYVTEHAARHVRVFTPAGKQIATIKVDANITNVAFGGAEGKTLYLTGAGSVWKLDLDVTGSPY